MPPPCGDGCLFFFFVVKFPFNGFFFIIFFFDDVEEEEADDKRLVVVLVVVARPTSSLFPSTPPPSTPTSLSLAIDTLVGSSSSLLAVSSFNLPLSFPCSASLLLTRFFIVAVAAQTTHFIRSLHTLHILISLSATPNSCSHNHYKSDWIVFCSCNDLRL